MSDLSLNLESFSSICPVANYFQIHSFTFQYSNDSVALVTYHYDRVMCRYVFRCSSDNKSVDEGEKKLKNFIQKKL